MLNELVGAIKGKRIDLTLTKTPKRLDSDSALTLTWVGLYFMKKNTIKKGINYRFHGFLHAYSLFILKRE